LKKQGIRRKDENNRDIAESKQKTVNLSQLTLIKQQKVATKRLKKKTTTIRRLRDSALINSHSLMHFNSLNVKSQQLLCVFACYPVQQIKLQTHPDMK